MAIRYLNKGVSLKEKGLHAEALENFKRAEDHSWSASSPALLATVMQNLGELLQTMGDENEAFDQYSHAVEKLERLVEGNPSFKEQLAITLSKYGSMLVDRGKEAEAKAVYEKAIVLYRELRREFPRNVQIRSNMVSTLNNLGGLLADMGLIDEAQWKFDKALKMLDNKQCVAENYTHCFEKKAMVLENLANLLSEKGEPEQAREALEKVLNIYFSLLDQGHMPDLYRERVASVLNRMAHLLVSLNRKEEALQSYNSLVQMYDELAGVEPENADLNVEKALVLSNMADLLEGLHKEKEAVDKYEEALDILLKLKNELKSEKYSSIIIPIHLNLGKLFISQGKVTEGLEKLDDAFVIISSSSEEQDLPIIDLGYSCLMQACEILSEKSDDENPIFFEKLLDLHSKLGMYTIPSQGMLCKAKIMEALGRAQLNSGKSEIAIGNFTEAIDIYRELMNIGDHSSEISNLSDLIEANMSCITEDDELDTISCEISDIFEEEDVEPEIIEANMSCIMEDDELDSVSCEMTEIFEEEDVELETIAENGSIMDTQERLADLALDKGRYEQAFDLYLEIYSADKSREGLLKKVAFILGNLEADMHLNRRSGSILKDMEFLVKGYTALAGFEPSNSEHRRNLAAIEKEMGSMLLDTGYVDEARQSLVKALDNYLLLLGMPGNKHHLKGTYAVLKELTALLPTIGDKERELKCQEKISKSYSLMCELDPKDAGLVEDLATSLDHQASLLASLDRKKDAYEILNQALDKYELLYQLESSYKHAGKAAVAMNNMGALLAKMGKKEEAKQMLEDALRIYNYLLDQEPDNTEHMVHAACTLDNMGTLFGNMDRLEDAKHMYQSALQMYMDITGVNPDDTSCNEYAATTMENLGSVLERMGRRDDAKWMYDNANKLRIGEA